MEQKQPTAKKPLDRKLQNKNFLILAAAGLILFTIGIIAFGMGAFSDDKPKEENLAAGMVPPDAKNTALEEDKYKDFTSTSNNQGQAMNNFQSLDGETNYRNSSNENLTEADFNAVNSYSKNQPVYVDKSKANAQFQQRLSRQNSQNAYYANPTTPIAYKTKADLREEETDREYKERNMKAQEDVITIMKNQNQNYQNTSSGELNTKGPSSDNLTFEQRMAAKNGYKDRYADLDNYQPNNQQQEATIRPVTSPNTIGSYKPNGFYNLSTKNQRSTYTANDASLAVVHGDADGVTVGNGGTIKVRLLQNTVLQIDQNNEILLKTGTLISGIASIKGDRLMITINTVVLGNSIYPVNMVAFDLDGMPGLNVPELASKSRFRQQAGQNLTQPLSGGAFFGGNGNFGQQLGNSVAMQLGQSAVQLGQTALTTRAQNVKVTIKSNYKILLKSDNLNSSYK
jgi:conjugative transposon TraM protein